MPADMTQYGPAWPAFSAWIRHTRAHDQCECTGECQLHTPNPTPRRCVERNGDPARFARGRIALTVAHLCKCNPPCTIPRHVKAMCQRCHLRCDRHQHARNRRRTERARHTNSLPPPQSTQYNPPRQMHPRRDTLRRF